MTAEGSVAHAAVEAVVFDIGNVLVVWEPRLLYRQLSDDDDAVEAFLAQVCTGEWNHRGDLGEPWEDLVAELAADHPEHVDWIHAYHQRWDEMLGGVVEGSAAALRVLRANGVPVYGLSNFSAEHWPIAAERFDILDELDDVLLSGHEGLAKPDPAFFTLAEDRFGVTPSTTLFIDDRGDNIAAADAAGWLTHRFTDVPGLHAALARLNLPTPGGRS